MKDLADIPTGRLNAAQKEFLALLQLAGWSQAEAARQLGVSRAMVTQTLKGKTTPEAPTMALLRMKVNGPVYVQRPPQFIIIEEEKDLNAKTGASRTGHQSAKEGKRGGMGRLGGSLAPPGLIERFALPVIAFARGGEGSYPEDMEHAAPRLLAPCPDPNAYVLELEGDSMEPLYSPGDLLVVAPNTPPNNNDLVIVKTVKGEVFFKILKHPGRGEGEQLQFISYNPRHPPILLRPDQIFRVSVVDLVIKPLKRKLRAMTVSESAHL